MTRCRARGARLDLLVNLDMFAHLRVKSFIERCLHTGRRQRHRAITSLRTDDDEVAGDWGVVYPDIGNGASDFDLPADLTRKRATLSSTDRPRCSWLDRSCRLSTSVVPPQTPRSSGASNA